MRLVSMAVAAAFVALRAAAATVALVGGTVLPSPDAKPIRNGVVVIADGTIAAVGGPATKVPRDSVRLNCRGALVVAGFWNSHVHFAQMKWTDAAQSKAGELAEEVEDMLTRYGFTSVFDTGSYLENTLALRRRIEAGELPGPRILTTGEIIFPRGGKFPEAVAAALGFMIGPMPEVATSEEGARAAATLLDGGADAVKIYAATWAGTTIVMPQPAVDAIAGEAHRRHKLLFAHPSNEAGIRAALDGGADILTHTAPQAGRWSPELIHRLIEKNVALIPTLKLWMYESRHGRQAWARPFIEAGVEQLRSFSAAGGTVLFGTDVGYMEDYDPADEYRLMARAGMSFPQILASLTTAPARRFGFAERSGMLAAGYDGDVTVVPLAAMTDVAQLANVRYTLRKGKVIHASP